MAAPVQVPLYCGSWSGSIVAIPRDLIFKSTQNIGGCAEIAEMLLEVALKPQHHPSKIRLYMTFWTEIIPPKK